MRSEIWSPRASPYPYSLVVHYEVVHLKLLIMTLQTEENRGPVKIIQGESESRSLD